MGLYNIFSRMIIFDLMGTDASDDFHVGRAIIGSTMPTSTINRWDRSSKYGWFIFTLLTSFIQNHNH